MPRILFTDHEFPDLRIERDLFAAAGVDVAVTQAKTEDEVIEAAQGCYGMLVQYAPVSERVVAALPGLAIVSRIGAGFDTVDTDACARHGVWVANSPDYGVGEVATHALALALALLRNIVAYHRDVTAGRWHYLSSGELRRAGDMTLGIVGLGRIGKRMAHVARNTFRRVVAVDPYIIDGDFPAYVERASLTDVFAQADVVSLHVPLTAETRGMVDAGVLGVMRPGSYLVNTSRGAVVDVDAALSALERGTLGGPGAGRAAGRAGAGRVEAARPSTRDPHPSRSVLLGRGGTRTQAQGRAESRHLPAHRPPRVRRRGRHPQSLNGDPETGSGRIRSVRARASRAAFDASCEAEQVCGIIAPIGRRHHWTNGRWRRGSFGCPMPV